MIKIDDDVVGEGHGIGVVNRLEILNGREVFGLEGALFVVKVMVEEHKNLKSQRGGSELEIGYKLLKSEMWTSHLEESLIFH